LASVPPTVISIYQINTQIYIVQTATPSCVLVDSMFVTFFVVDGGVCNVAFHDWCNRCLWDM